MAATKMRSAADTARIMHAAFAALLFIACPRSHADTTPNSSGHKWKIGLSTALTGSAATYGLDIRDSLFFAVEKLGNGRYEIVVEDDKCDAKEAVTIAHKFADIDKVDAVIGPACSTSVLAAAPIYERAKIVSVVTNASAPKIADAGDYLFRTEPSDAALAVELSHAAAKASTTIGVISEQTDYAQGLKEAFSAEFLKKPGASVAAEDYNSGAADFRTMLAKLRSKNVDALLLNTQTEEGFAALVRQVRDLKWNVQLYGAYWPSSPSFLKIAGPLAEGIIFADTPSLEDALSEDGQSVYKDFLKSGHSMRSTEIVFATTYEGFHALQQALSSGVDTRKFLYEAKFSGIFGPFSFDSRGEIVGLSFVIKQIRDGKPVVLK